MGEVRFNLVVIRSTHLDRAARFYTLLGLNLKEHRHGNGPMHFAAENAGQTFEIYPLREGATPTTEARLGFSVDDVDSVFERLIVAGAKPVSKPKSSEWGRRAVVCDPDGHRIELTS